MRRLLLCAALGLPGALGFAQPAAGPGDPAEAARAYDAGDYEAAARIWRGLLNGTATDRAALHYNLGNAEYRGGRLGRAMLEWERSLVLRPGDGDARANVALARRILDERLTEAAAAGDPEPFLMEVLRSMQGFGVWLRQTPAARFAAALLAGALAAGVLLTLLLLGRGRRSLLVAGLGLGLATAAASGVLLRLRLTVPGIAVVVEPGAALRSGPGDSFPQLAALPEGLYLELDDAGRVTEDGFRRYVAAGIVGYADEASVVPVDAPFDGP